MTKFSKPKRYQNPDYLDYLRTLPCVMHIANKSNCYAQGDVDPHHVKSRGSGGGDDQCVPLCRFHHSLIHTVGRKTFEERCGINLMDEANKLWEEWDG